MKNKIASLFKDKMNKTTIVMLKSQKEKDMKTIEELKTN